MLSGGWHGFCSRVREHCTAAAHPQTHHKGGEGMLVREIISTDIEVVDRNDNLRTVEERMATKQLRHLPVLEQGEVEGMVTQRDLFKAVMSSAMGYGEKAQQERPMQVKNSMCTHVTTVTPETLVSTA
jgi:acetoin utilization protein AcuB